MKTRADEFFFCSVLPIAGEWGQQYFGYQFRSDPETCSKAKGLEGFPQTRLHRPDVISMSKAEILMVYPWEGDMALHATLLRACLLHDLFSFYFSKTDSVTFALLKLVSCMNSCANWCFSKVMIIGECYSTAPLCFLLISSIRHFPSLGEESWHSQDVFCKLL